MSCVKIKWIDINSFDVHIKKVTTVQTSSLPIYFPKFDQIDINMSYDATVGASAANSNLIKLKKKNNF